VKIDSEDENDDKQQKKLTTKGTKPVYISCVQSCSEIEDKSEGKEHLLQNMDFVRDESSSRCLLKNLDRIVNQLTAQYKQNYPREFEWTKQMIEKRQTKKR
jgi:hypothetical protein